MDLSEKAKRLNILIVEDNTSFRQTFKEALESLLPSVTIHEAREGKEALQKLDTFQSNLVFMDIQLPGENGFQLTKRIKSTYPGTKIVILTGYDILEYREASIRCGADSFIDKNSLSWEQIEKIVNSLF